MSTPTTNCNHPQVPPRAKTPAPSYADLSDMEHTAIIAESYLSLLDNIITPPEKIGDPAPGLAKFDKDSRFAMSFMIGDILEALRHHQTLIEYSYNTIKPKGSMEVIS